MIKNNPGNKMKEIALVGNPNTGKTTIFNALTGLRHSTANYPGVTVEKKIGQTQLPGGEEISVLDLPGAYSLLPRSLDEEVVHDVLLGIRRDTPPPDLVLVILDANNLERNLYLATQVLETGIPVILVLNMWDMAKKSGTTVDLGKLSEITGVPCVATVGMEREGIVKLQQTIALLLADPVAGPTKFSLEPFLPDRLKTELDKIVVLIEDRLKDRPKAVFGEALRLLSDRIFRSPIFESMKIGDLLRTEVLSVRASLKENGIDSTSVEPECRYRAIDHLCGQVVQRVSHKVLTFSDRLDRILTHRVWGILFFIGIMGVIFQSIFSWAQVPMDLLSRAIEKLGDLAQGWLPAGALQSLVVDGIIAGVGNVIVFLPQIFLLFFFIALFEDTGYMARAVFVLDKLMKKVGLNGKAFLPLLSSFACTVPGILSTRTIEDRNDRLATILVAPLMSCSARLPIYTLLIAAFIPNLHVFHILHLQGLTLLGLYLLSIGAGLGVAALFRKTFLKGNRMPFVFELPPYRIPHLKTVFGTMWDRAKEFITRAGSIIFLLSIVLWFLVSYPKDPGVQARFAAERQQVSATLNGEALKEHLGAIDHEQKDLQLRSSFAGSLGKAIEPAIRPLGFNWEIGIGIIASFAARELLISTLAIVHHVETHGEGMTAGLIQALQRQRSPITGELSYTPLVALSLMVFYVLACQCFSTFAIVKRETGSWGWMFFMIFYMTGLAWSASFVVYQGGRLLGFE
ncbi:MAG: ferrous iron transport protein B [Candidatus Omnitrophota bacterium]